AIPFDIDGFIIDHVLLGRRTQGDYEILSTLVPEDDVRETLSRLAAIGSDPKLLTTKASALAALADRLELPAEGGYCRLAFSGGRCSVAVFVDGELRRLRDFPAAHGGEKGVTPQLLAQINCTLARAEKDLETQIASVYTVALPAVLEHCRRGLFRPVRPVDF